MCNHSVLPVIPLCHSGTEAVGEKACLQVELLILSWVGKVRCWAELSFQPSESLFLRLSPFKWFVLLEKLCKGPGYLRIVLDEMSGVVADSQEVPELQHAARGFDVLNGLNSPCLGFNAIGTHRQAHILNLGAAPLTLGKGQFGSCPKKLVEHVPTLFRCVSNVWSHMRTSST